MSSPGQGQRTLRPVTSCRIDLPEGRVRIQGVAGDVASVAVTEAGGSSTTATDPVADGRAVITHQDGALTIRSGASRPSAALGGLIASGGRTPLEVELGLPRDASIRVTTVGADVRLRGCQGGQSVSAVTGGIHVAEATGRVEARTVSGSVSLAGDRLDVEASTTSGSVRLDARRIASVRVRSVSGDIDVIGDLAPGATHGIETLSGDIDVRTRQGTTLVARTLSGRITAGEGARRDARHGVTVLTVGDGGAEVQARSVSGSIALGTAPGSDTRMAGDPADARDPVLDALEALARGDITVEEADRRLEVLNG